MSRADKYIVKTAGVVVGVTSNWPDIHTDTEYADASLVLSAVASALIDPLISNIEILLPDRTPREPATMFTEFDPECIPGELMRATLGTAKNVTRTIPSDTRTAPN